MKITFYAIRTSKNRGRPGCTHPSLRSEMAMRATKYGKFASLLPISLALLNAKQMISSISYVAKPTTESSGAGRSPHKN